MFLNISQKQALAYAWWRVPKFKHNNMFVAHGAIRTGKTVFASYGFFDWAEHTVLSTPATRYTQGWNKFNVIGATKYTTEDNVIDPIISYAKEKRGYKQVNYRARLTKYNKSIYNDRMSGVLLFKNGTHYFMFKYVGVNNKRSVISIQGATRRGTFIDEAALINVALIEQAIGRNITFPDHKIFMTCNPEGDESHDFYRQYVKGGANKGILVLQFELLDNPLFATSDVDRMRRIFTPVMYERKVLGKWVRDSGAIYKAFNVERHVDKFYDTMMHRDYAEIRIGIDYGERDATVFTLIGVKRNFMGIDVLSTYYHKNSDTSEKDINIYADDFFTWAQPHFEKLKKTMLVFVESASNGVTFYKVLKKRAVELRVNWFSFKLVNKSKRLHTSTSAIKERIDAMNIMLGADFIRIDASCKELVLAVKKSVWRDDREERLDDKTVDIDSLDSLEYAFVGLIPKIIERIEFLRR